MKNAFLSVALAATLALTGCAGFFVSQNGGGGGSSNSGIFYVLNYTTGQIVGYSVSSDTITAVSGANKSITSPTAIAVSQNNKYLYVGNLNGIYVYSISSGALTLISSTPLTTDIPQSMQVDSSNSWLVYAIQSTNTLVALPLKTSTGVLDTTRSKQPTTLNGSDPIQLVIAPDNDEVFVALGANGTDEVLFTSGSTDPFGTDTNTKVTGTNGTATTVAVDPKSEFLYIGETSVFTSTGTNNTGGIRLLAIGSAGALTEQTGTSYPYNSGGTAPSAILIDHNNNFVYVANQATVNAPTTVGNITGFSTDIVSNSGVYTNTLTELSNSPFTSGTGTYALAEDNSHSFVIALNKGGTPDLDVYTFDTNNTGNLANIIGTTTGTDPTGAFAVATEY